MITILYVHSGPSIRGGNKVLLDLIDGLDRSTFCPISLIPGAGPLEQELNKRRISYVILDPRPAGLTKLAKTLVRLRSHCVRQNADIIHANDPFSYRWISRLHICSSIKCICTVHHPGATPVSLNWAFRRPPRLVLTPSYFMKRQLEGCLDASLRERVQVLWNHIDTEWFRPADDVPDLKRRLRLDPDGANLTILAALTPHKGHVCFLRAARLILNSLPRVMFHIVGGAAKDHPAYVEFLRELAIDLGVADRVKFWGFVHDELARDLLQASDLFVLPTREEGFGLSIAEAQACQVPVLTSAIPPLDEVVAHGRTGYLLDPDNHSQFSEHVIRLLDSPRLVRGWDARGGVGCRAVRTALLFRSSRINLSEHGFLASEHVLGEIDFAHRLNNSSRVTALASPDHGRSTIGERPPGPIEIHKPPGCLFPHHTAGVPEIVTGGETGILIQPATADGYAE